jgi:hypothetical protein
MVASVEHSVQNQIVRELVPAREAIILVDPRAGPIVDLKPKGESAQG